MEEQTSGKYSGHVRQTDDVAEPEGNKTAEGTAQSGEMTAEEIEERLKQMLERGEIGMSQYNLARQDLLKYGARFEDMPYLFVGKELPLDLTKESRKWYNARLPRDEAVKLLKNPNITAMKMKAIREHYQLLPDEEMLSEALAERDDKSFTGFLDDYKTRSNPLALSRRMDRMEKAVDTIEKKVEEIGTGVGEVKKSVELLKDMFQTINEQKKVVRQDSDTDEVQTESQNAVQMNTEDADVGEEYISEEAGENAEDAEYKNLRDGGLRGQKKSVELKPHSLNSREDEKIFEEGEPGELTDTEDGGNFAEDSILVSAKNHKTEEEPQEHKQKTLPDVTVEDEKTETIMPAFFRKLLPGFYHPKKKDYIQLKQREREQQDHLAEMRRMADDLYAQNYMDEETYFIFCELAFKEQALDKETADLLIDGIKRGIPFALLFKVVRNVKNTSDWEASVNLLESLLMYQKQNDERAVGALNGRA